MYCLPDKDVKSDPSLLDSFTTDPPSAGSFASSGLDSDIKQETSDSKMDLEFKCESFF